MRGSHLLVFVLFAGAALAQGPTTYGFVLNEFGAVKSADCSFADNAKGCQLFNELLSADDTFAASFSVSRTSLACFVTDDPSQSTMFFVFSLDPKSKLPSSLTVYRDGLPVNIMFFRFAANQTGGFDLKPEGEANVRGILDDGLLSYHHGVSDASTQRVNWDYWYFEINMKTGRFRHGVDPRVSAGRCARHDARGFN